MLVLGLEFSKETAPPADIVLELALCQETDEGAGSRT